MNRSTEVIGALGLGSITQLITTVSISRWDKPLLAPGLLRIGQRAGSADGCSLTLGVIGVGQTFDTVVVGRPAGGGRVIQPLVMVVAFRRLPTAVVAMAIYSMAFSWSPWPRLWWFCH